MRDTIADTGIKMTRRTLLKAAPLVAAAPFVAGPVGFGPRRAEAAETPV